MSSARCFKEIGPYCSVKKCVLCSEAEICFAVLEKQNGQIMVAKTDANFV